MYDNIELNRRPWFDYDVDEMPEVYLYDVEDLLEELYDKASKYARAFFEKHEDIIAQWVTEEFEDGEACFERDEEHAELEWWAEGMIDEFMQTTYAYMKEAEEMNEYTTEEAELKEILGLR